MKGFKQVKAYLPDQGIVVTDIGIENGKIAFIGNDDSIESIGEFNGIVLPGFIDQHIHGAGGADAMDGTIEALQTISETVAKEGTTAFLATTMTQSKQNISNALAAVKQIIEEKNYQGAEILGVHLEGPFIAKDYIGAQPLEYVVDPDIAAFAEYQKAAGGFIRSVTLAPEVSGGYALVEYLKNSGVNAQVGHSGAGFEEVAEAEKHGLAGVTHTYNAQSKLHHREVGVVGSAMLLDGLYTEIICDTIHVSVPAIQLLIKNKPHGKVVAITDAMRAKGLSDGVSELGGQTVYVKNGEARLANGALAGSILKMNDAIKNLVTVIGVPFADAVDFATINPAKALGLDGERGSIAVGKRADFTVLDESFEVLATVVEGRIVYSK